MLLLLLVCFLIGFLFDVICCLKIVFFCLIWQNESSSNTNESAEKETEFENKLEMDRSKRFDYLLKQTEIFTHFMTNTGPKSPNKAKTVGRPKKNKEPTDAAELVFLHLLQITRKKW